MFITNFNERNREKYNRAVKEYKKQTGNNDIYVDNNAYANGCRLENSCALRSKSSSFENLNKFYRIEEELELIGTNIKCINIKEGKEIFGKIDKVHFNENGKILAYDVTNCDNKCDLYIEDYIYLNDWIVVKY